MQNRLSRQQIDRLHELCDTGMQYDVVSERLGITISSISYHRRKIGKARQVKHQKPPSSRADYMRKLASSMTLQQWLSTTGFSHTTYYYNKKKASSENQ